MEEAQPRYVEVGVAGRVFLGAREFFADSDAGPSDTADTCAHSFVRALVPRDDGSSRRQEWRALVAGRIRREFYAGWDGAVSGPEPEWEEALLLENEARLRNESRLQENSAACCALLEQLADAPVGYTLVLKLPRPYYAEAYAIGVAGPDPAREACGAAAVVPGLSEEVLDCVREDPSVFRMHGVLRGSGTLGLPADCADAGPGGAFPPRATLRNVLILDYSYE